MKKVVILLSLVLSACGGNNGSQNQQAQQTSQLVVELAQARDSIRMLNATIEALSYPANQRLANIQSLIKEGNYDAAIGEVFDLVRLFPNSPEAKMEDSLLERIDKGREAKIAEEKRLKALGFKVLKDNASVSFGGIKATFSNVSIGTSFTFDNYGYEYHYIKADKDSKYVTAAMSITSEGANPKLPQCAVYVVDEDNLVFISTLVTKFARWDDYGSYLGNYSDYNNDFAKVNTVRFKIGAQILNDEVAKPFVVVMKKENALSRQHDEYSNPEISYVGRADFKNNLTVDDFGENGQYVSIKRFNFNKL